VLVDWAILFYFLFFWRFSFYLTIGTDTAGCCYVGVPLAGDAWQRAGKAAFVCGLSC
jgi:hypothetical protein